MWLARFAETLLFLIGVLLAGNLCWAQNARQASPLENVPFSAVDIDEGFWGARMKTNREATIPHLIAMCELEGRVRNMWRAAGKLGGPFEGTRTHDADMFKVIEAASYALRQAPDRQLENKLDEWIAAIQAAQQPDGYLHSYVTTRFPYQKQRNNLQLFASGHLIDAGVAHYEATGKSTLLATAERFANLIDSLIKPGHRLEVPSHPKIEESLVRLYRTTGETRYLDLARLFVDERGRADSSDRRSHGLHAQDHLPCREQRNAVGHVICGLFLWTGMYNLGSEIEDHELQVASRALFRDATSRRMYVTGGMGRSSDERFDEPFKLDNSGAIAEGCQAAAVVRFAHRLLLETADARYADVIERVLYNTLLASVSLDGKRFYYVNRLSARPEEATGRPYRHPLRETVKSRYPRFCLERQPWFKVPCCPPNVSMAIATVGEHVYAKSRAGLYVNLFIAGSATVELGDTRVRISQKTQYPWSGTVTIQVDPSSASRFALFIRIPDWLRDMESTDGLYRPTEPVEVSQLSLKVNNRPVGIGSLEKGFARIDREWSSGDVVKLQLPMPVTLVKTHPEVEENRGKVAITRGPVIYCLEAIDHGSSVQGLHVPMDSRLKAEYRPDLLGGVTVIQGEAVRVAGKGSDPRRVGLTAIPYGTWGNRQADEMDVWIPTWPTTP